MSHNKNFKNIICGETFEFKKYTKGLGEYFFENGNKHSDNIFQIDTKTSELETYESIIKRSIRLAVNLQKMGATSKDMITICSHNTMDNCVPFLAGLFLGTKISAVYHKQSAREWTHCLNICLPSFIFVDEDCVENMEKCLKNLKSKPKLIVFGKSDKYKSFINLITPSDDEAAFCPFAVQDCHETAIILFSSGTTGLPKGLFISHYCLINMFMPKSFSTASRTPSFVVLNYSTLYWISGLSNLIIHFSLGQTKLIPPPEYNPTEMLEIIEKYKVNSLIINPVLIRSIFTLNNIKNYDILSVTILLTIGTSLHRNDGIRLNEIFKNAVIVRLYGTSETLSAGASSWFIKNKRFLNKFESVGQVSPFCEIKIMDPETSNIFGPNQTGEICIKTPFGFSGYCYEDSTKYFDEDGFFKTGDLGYYDEDECFYIVGRLKENFKYRDYPVVSPVYLESILQEHPDVLLSGVFGIPDKENSHLPAACVVLKDKATTTVDDIEQFYAKHVSDGFKLRGGIKIVKELPMTPTFKVQRNKLLDLFLTS